MAKLPIPNVPQLPGVPPLPGGGLGLLPPVALALTDALGLDFFGPSQWGIFGQDGSPIIVADSVFTMEYARDYRISDCPQEEGAFQSYNKVQVPYLTKLTFLISGSDEKRAAFLSAVEAAVGSLDLVSVVTPEVSYANANLTHYDYRRTDRDGYKMIEVNVWCEEVRVTATAQTSATQVPSTPANAATPAAGQSTPAPTSSGTLSNTRLPNGSATQHGGAVQPVPTVATVTDTPASEVQADVNDAASHGEGGFGDGALIVGAGGATSSGGIAHVIPGGIGFPQ